MARPCSICIHPDSASIESAIRNGASQRSVAKTHGVTYSAIQRHMIHAKKLPASMPSSPASTSSDAGPLGFMVEKARLTKVQADTAELMLAQKAGDLLERDAVEQTWADLLMRVRAKILGLPRKMAPLLVGLTSPLQAETLLTAEARNILMDLSDDDFS